jgi:hypothetical protein
LSKNGKNYKYLMNKTNMRTTEIDKINSKDKNKRGKIVPF